MRNEQKVFPFTPFRNSNLFSNHWLEHRLPLEPEWQEQRENANQALARLEDIWKLQQTRVEKYGDEQGLEDAFILPVLKALGWKVKYQTFLRGGKPDYALFLTDPDYDAALNAGRNSPDFWKYPKLLADAKAWHVNLDRPTRVGNQREYPPEQIERYLQHSSLDWAILTNGRLWRLIPRTLGAYQPRFQTYLECDLPALLDILISSQDPDNQFTFKHHQPAYEDFLRFYYFFSPQAFVAVAPRPALIQRAEQGSSEYRVGVGRNLRAGVFEALRLCIEGFLKHSPNNLNADTDLVRCRENSFVLLYRLLFIMYAEDRGLLPYRINPLYTDNRSLSRHRDEIAATLDRIKDGRAGDYSPDSTAIWKDILNLFDLIDHGHARYQVPPYNGGLFDADQNPFLFEKVLPDPSIARVIDQLGRTIDPDHPEAELCRIDYRDLAIQHLGSIYEGLLEQSVERAPDGTVNIVPQKGERRSSGSYYTPDHIVNYIVEKTLRPLCHAIDEDLKREIERTEQALKSSGGFNREEHARKLETLQADFDDRILRLKVLDPAMGSGHFLLRACQYLAEEIATNPHAGDAVAAQLKGDESLLTFWKRRVVERCLYGVDLNPLAVELAKLALWLETVAVGQPLSFLNHHLRHGNSLVGADFASLGGLPGERTLLGNVYAERVNARLPMLLRPLARINELPSETVEQVKEKEKLYRRAFEPVRQPFLRAADLWCGAFFLSQLEGPKPDMYRAALDALDNPKKSESLAQEPWFARSVAAAQAPDVAAFHWELEFPEVFFDQHQRDYDAGFHAIIGNPPYDVLAEKELVRDLSSLVSFLKAQKLYEPSFRGKNNLYKLFICRALNLLAEGGRFGFIVPMPLLGDDQAAAIRKEIFRVGAFTSIDSFPQKDDPARRVFTEAKLSTAVFTLIKTRDKRLRTQPFTSRVHPAEGFDLNSPSLQLTTESIPLYDPSNLTVVSCSQKDWNLAVRIIQSGRMGRLDSTCTSFQGEVNETNEKARHALSDNPADGPLVLRGANLCLYAVREASQGEDFYLKEAVFLAGKALAAKAYHGKQLRLGFQRSSPQNNFRRIVAALIQPGNYCFDTVSYVPASQSRAPLTLLLGLLNSKLADWYFRLGSTNSKVNEYQFNNLPCPVFHDKVTPSDTKARHASLKAVQSGDMPQAFETLRPLLDQVPFSPAIRDVIVALVNRICAIETVRGEIARSERSHLDPAAQPCQDLIDRLFYAMAGLTEDEARGLEERLSHML